MIAGFSPSNISKGKRENSFPSAETAVEIAKILNTTVEYLVTGDSSKSSNTFQNDSSVYYRYSKTIKNLNSIPADRRKLIETMIQDMGGLE